MAKFADRLRAQHSTERKQGETTMMLTLDRPLRSFLPAQLTIDGSSLTIVPGSGTAIPLGVALEQCPHCSEDSYRVPAPLLSWQDADETVWRFTCCEHWCSGCRSVVDPDREFFCWHCEQCGSCCECTRCQWCEEVAHIVCGDCQYCTYCTDNRCTCQPEYDYDAYEDSLHCGYDAYETKEGFVAQYGRHTDLARFVADVDSGRIPQEPGMGYVACWIAPDGAVMACYAHYRFDAGYSGDAYTRPFAAGYVRITAMSGSYGMQVGNRLPTDEQLTTLAALLVEFGYRSTGAYFDSRLTFPGAKGYGRVDTPSALWMALGNRPMPSSTTTDRELCDGLGARTKGIANLRYRMANRVGD